jgi:predicted exporter
VIAIAGALVLVAGAELGAVRYETNLERVFSRDIEAVDTARRIHALFGLDPGPWVVPADDLDEARRLTAAFEADPTFGRVESLALVLRDDVDARERILDALAPELARRIRSRETAAREQGGVAAERTREALEPLSLLLAAQVLGPPRMDALPAALSRRLTGPDGELLLFAFPAEPALDSEVAALERRAAQAIDPRATSMSAIYEALIGTNRPWLPPILVGVLVFVAGVIRLDLGSARLTLLALLPAAVSLVVTVGGLTAAGFAFNTVTLVAIPVLFGLAVDDGIHVVHRMLEQPDAPLREAVGSVARSIGLTTATTCASVGLLLFTRHPGIESVAILLGVGLPVSLVATVTLVPAVAPWLDPAAAGRRPGSRTV